MANLSERPTGSSDDGIKTLSDLYNLVGAGGGKTETTSGGTSTQLVGGSETTGGSSSFQDAYTDSSSDTVHSSISAEGLNSMLKNILEGTQGLAAVSSGQRGAGGYSGSTQTLLLNDLMARAAGQVAQNDKTTTTNTVHNVSARNGGSSTFQSTTPHTVTTTKEPSTVVTAPTKSNPMGKVLGLMGLYGQGKKLFDSSGLGKGAGTDSASNTAQENFRADEIRQENAAFDATPTQTEASIGGNYVTGGDLGPGPDIYGAQASAQEYNTLDTLDTLDTPALDVPDLPTLDVPDTPDVTAAMNTPDVNEWDLDFADGGSVGAKASRVNNIIGFQGNKIVDARQSRMGKEGTSVNGPVTLIDPVATASVNGSNATRTTPTAAAAQAPGHRIVGNSDMSQLVDTSATTEDGIHISDYLNNSGGPNRAGSPTSIPAVGMDVNGQNPNAGAAINTGLNIAGGIFPPLGMLQAGTNFIQNPGATTGLSLANKFLKIPGLELAVKAYNALTEGAKGDDGSKLENSRRLSKDQERDAKEAETGAARESGRFEQAKATINATTNDTNASAIQTNPLDNASSNTADAIEDDPLATTPEIITPSTDTTGTGTAATVELDVDGNPIVPGTSTSSGAKLPSGGVDTNNSAGSSSWSTPGATYAADGGHIDGPGTSISDSIPAHLSADEYVLPADVVEAIGIDKLDSIVKRYHTPAAIQKLRGGR